MLQRLARLILALAATLAFSTSFAAELPKPIADIAAQSGSFASNEFNAVVTGPYGGSYDLDTSAWTGTNGTIKCTYSAYKLPNGWSYAGSWSFTGSVGAGGILSGTLNGTWSIAGLTIPGFPSGLPLGITAVFANGNATLTVSISGIAIPVGTFPQAQGLSLLL